MTFESLSPDNSGECWDEKWLTDLASIGLAGLCDLAGVLKVPSEARTGALVFGKPSAGSHSRRRRALLLLKATTP